MDYVCECSQLPRCSNCLKVYTILDQNRSHSSYSTGDDTLLLNFTNTMPWRTYLPPPPTPSNPPTVLYIDTFFRGQGITSSQLKTDGSRFPFSYVHALTVAKATTAAGATVPKHDVGCACCARQLPYRCVTGGGNPTPPPSTPLPQCKRGIILVE